MGVIVWRAVAHGESFRSRGNCPGGNFMGGSCPREELVRGNCPGPKSWVVIILEEFHGGNCPGAFVQGGIVIEPYKSYFKFSS